MTANSKVDLKDFKKVGTGDIPDKPGAETGILGVKAPAGYKQEGDIRDRLQAAGKLGTPIAFVVKQN
jgi:hypothetical protein